MSNTIKELERLKSTYLNNDKIKKEKNDSDSSSEDENNENKKIGEVNRENKARKRGPKKTEDIKEYHKNYKKSEKWQKYLTKYVEENKDTLNAKKREDRRVKKETYLFLKDCILNKKIKFNDITCVKTVMELFNLQVQINPEDYLF